MFVDARTLETDLVIETDLCIVGAAAGITIAREFAGTGVDVCMLSSGGFEPDTETESLDEGAVVGHPYRLEVMRHRCFGGPSTYWSGWCRPLEELDLEPRPWVAHSGWPIRRRELDPYYERAQQACELGDYDYDVEQWASSSRPLLPLAGDDIKHVFWQFSPPTNFGSRYRQELGAADNIRVLLNATAVGINTDEGARHVHSIRAACLNGKKLEVRARRFVLACGGIDNPRMLLLADNVEPGGLGNRHDLVGRFYSDHPHIKYANDVLFVGPETNLALYHKDYRFMQRARRFLDRNLGFGRPVPRDTVAGLGLTEAAQRREQILNCSVQLYVSPLEPAPVGFGRDIARMIRGARRTHARGWGATAGSEGSEGALIARMYVRSEQMPNPDSRITLSDRRDALGLPKVRHDWQLTNLDKRTILVMSRLLGRALGRAGLGRVRLDEWLTDGGDSWQNLEGWGHPSGTTRMSDDPRRGVVDSNCRVHGIDNLWVAGSSVFPTTGAAHPTLTIVALSYRLADLLKSLT